LLLSEQVFRPDPENLSVTLDDDAIPTFLVTKQGIADALAERVVDGVPLVVKDAIWILCGVSFHGAFCRMM
jgi:hypothetical protein